MEDTHTSEADWTGRRRRPEFCCDFLWPAQIRVRSFRRGGQKWLIMLARPRRTLFFPHQNQLLHCFADAATVVVVVIVIAHIGKQQAHFLYHRFNLSNISTLVSEMIIESGISTWKPSDVYEWMTGLCQGQNEWINKDFIETNNIDGRRLLLLSADDLIAIGAKKVDFQEKILEAIQGLRDQLNDSVRDTLQHRLDSLACASRMLHNHLARKQVYPEMDYDHDTEFNEQLNLRTKQDQVTLDTLSYVSAVIESVMRVVDVTSAPPFKDDAEIRSFLRSPILAIGIELASTAQRGQFVEEPNEFLMNRAKALARHCDIIIQNIKDPLLIQAL